MVHEGEDAGREWRELGRLRKAEIIYSKCESLAIVYFTVSAVLSSRFIGQVAWRTVRAFMFMSNDMHLM